VENVKVMRISRKPSPVQTTIDQEELENVEYFSYLGSVVTNGARLSHESKSKVAMEKAAFNRKNSLFISKLDLNLRNKQVKCYVWRVVLKLEYFGK
jgi:hypothetical protein